MLIDAACRPEPVASSSPLESARRRLAVAAVLYAAAAGVLIAIAPHSPRTWHLLPDWIAAPVQAIAIASCATLVWGRWRRRGQDRTVWALVLAFCIMSLLSSYAWNDWRPLGKVPALSFPDLCYLTDYALLTVAYAVAFLRYGGSLRDPRTWLDVLTVVVALLGSFWGTFLGTFQPSAHGQHVGISYALAYSTSLSLWMAMATLLFLRMPSLRLMPMLLVGAGLVDAIWEVGWLATWLTDHNYVGLYYNFGDVLCFTMIAAAAGITPQRPDPQERVVSAERSVYEFLPTLSVLVAIALVGATLASTRASEAWILVGLVTLTALLLVTRQAAARRKLAELNRVLAVRAADARVTELVRQSSDAILVIDARGLVAFASPATETIIGVAPPKVIGTSAALLLGAEHREAIERFLRRLKAESTPPTSLELPVEVPFGPPRILKLHGTNRLSNAHIDGLTLTISDVSEQRGLERDVLTAANHERLRLAGDIHDGLGQELSGIALMLQGLAKSPNLGVAQQQAELRTITAHVTQAISGARDLARGLSPIYVVRGSLCDALRRLGREVGNTPPVHVEVDRRLVDWAFDELPADHLYRIAREAVQNACRHGSCSRIDVRLRMNDDTLLLEVTDDGVGYGHPATTDSGFGLRLMEYRARVIGASFEIGPRPEGGTSVRVRVGASVVAEESKTGVIH